MTYRYILLFFIATVLAFAISQTNTAQAQNQPDWVIYGSGGDSCGKFLAATYGHPPGSGTELKGQENSALYFDQTFLYAQWIQGYISALNLSSAQKSSEFTDQKQITVDMAAIDVWLKNWCKDNPTKPLGTAVTAFVREEHKR